MSALEAEPPGGLVEDAAERAAQEAWAALAHELAGRPRVRVSSDRGRSYARRWERALSPELPPKPAAVPIYDASGSTRTIVLDLDVGQAGVDQLARDLASLQDLMGHVGAGVIVDRSPTGGHHLYLPLVEPVPMPQARALVYALGARTPSLDKTPMLNASDGLIRPPGSRHPSGGFQQLVTPLNEAVRVARDRNSVLVWDELCAVLGIDPTHAEALLAPEPARSFSQSHADAAEPAGGTDAEPLAALPGWDAPDAAHLHIARTGDLAGTPYASTSEARQAVLWRCVAAGWSFGDVARRLEDGTWPGMAAFYAKYRHRRHKALAGDWHQARAFERTRREQHRRNSVQVGRTSTHKTRPAPARPPPATAHQAIRVWRSAAELAAASWSDRGGWRRVLGALAEAAHKTGALEVAFGVRSLAIASGLDDVSVAKILRQLREAEDPFVDLIRPGRGVSADLYQLRVPTRWAEAAQRRPWPPGKAYGLRPVFRELGATAGWAYEALQNASGPLRLRELAAAARISLGATHSAVATLRAWNLARATTAGGLVPGPVDVERLAEQLGVDAALLALIERYRAERRAWWAVLGVVRLEPTTQHSPASEHLDEPPDWPHRPDRDPLAEDQEEMALWLVQRALGATIVSEGPAA